MQVQLLANTENLLDVAFTGARTCYNPGSPIDMWTDVSEIDKEKKIKLLKMLVRSGHESVIEHINFTFAIVGISRACSHQLVRHRHCSFSQQSQRYVDIKEPYEALKEIRNNTQKLKIAGKYFDFCDAKIGLFCYEALLTYLELVQVHEYEAEDARAVLPNCTKTNLVVTCNLRELIHLCNERLCTRAQGEIRQMVKDMAWQVVNLYPWMSEWLQPKCERLGYCPEHDGCGRKKRKEEVL